MRVFVQTLEKLKRKVWNFRNKMLLKPGFELGGGGAGLQGGRGTENGCCCVCGGGCIVVGTFAWLSGCFIS